jgi:hypothetical protein
MVSVTLQGAYGRDYKDARSMVLDLLAGKDFRGTNPSIEMLGALINYRDLVQNLGATSLSLRYSED